MIRTIRQDYELIELGNKLSKNKSVVISKILINKDNTIKQYMMR